MIRAMMLVIGLLLAALVGASTPANAVGCPTGWGSLPKSSSQNISGNITGIRAGIQPCFDRLVFDIQGPRAGYIVEYRNVILNDPQGIPLNVPGGAKLAVVVFAHGENRPALPSVSGFPVFRSVVWAGSFEGLTSIGLGVRARLPFRVFTLANPNRLVVDVARSWNP